VFWNQAILWQRLADPRNEIDPADRFLAATAKTFGLTLVTADENLIRGRGYTVLANRQSSTQLLP
jgi:PIN domain nuclease of toxin-antitoxin system